jgi:hypothetical protein
MQLSIVWNSRSRGAPMAHENYEPNGTLMFLAADQR